MKFKGKKLIEFAGELGGCAVTGIVSAAAQTLWYRVVEPKILDVMAKNDVKQKHPIGFRGANGLLSFFRRFYKSYYEEEVSSIGRAPPFLAEVIGSSPMQPL